MHVVTENLPVSGLQIFLTDTFEMEEGLLIVT